jgi:hypothetical protein
MAKPKGQRGQSTVEFVLLAPLLFFIFFAILQLFYIGYVSLAVQRAALSIAQETALTTERSDNIVHAKLIYSLLPISKLNRTTLACAMASQCQIKTQSEKVRVQVRYPMPIWIPLVGRVFGESIIPSANYNNTPYGQAIRRIFQLLGKNPPDLSFTGLKFPHARWISFEAETFNEGAK